MDTAQRVADAINAGLWLGGILLVYFFLSHRSEDGGATRWERWVGRYIMSPKERADRSLESNEDWGDSPATTTQQNSNNGIATPTTDSNALLLQAKAATLAAMVKAGKVGETEGIKLVFGVAPSSSNPRYIAARAALKEELAKLDPPKFRMTPEQENARAALGLK